MVAALQGARCWVLIAVTRTLARPLVDDVDEDDDDGDEQAMWPARRRSRGHRVRRVSFSGDRYTMCAIRCADAG